MFDTVNTSSYDALDPRFVSCDSILMLDVQFLSHSNPKVLQSCITKHSWFRVRVFFLRTPSPTVLTTDNCEFHHFVWHTIEIGLRHGTFHLPFWFESQWDYTDILVSQIVQSFRIHNGGVWHLGFPHFKPISHCFFSPGYPNPISRINLLRKPELTQYKWYTTQ